MMKDAGLDLPEVEVSDEVSSGKLLDEAPLPGEIGKWIFANVDAQLWGTWIGQGTKVINELRLDFSREEDQLSFEDYMVEFLGVPSDIVELDRKARSK